ncbi:hypothetical protein [Streptomyces sp. NPDC007856]
MLDVEASQVGLPETVVPEHRAEMTIRFAIGYQITGTGGWPTTA